ncbi:MAG: hypothetical protein LBI65_02070, partial [Candidatus Symbiothrix sp.]|nr:hypothetical protein [Candidatus Symbiothrix sp.]
MNRLFASLCSILLVAALNISVIYGETINTFPYIESFEYENIDNSPWVQYRQGEEAENNWRT